jgi:hypothetical protein
MIEKAPRWIERARRMTKKRLTPLLKKPLDRIIRSSNGRKDTSKAENALQITEKVLDKIEKYFKGFKDSSNAKKCATEKVLQ